MKNTSKHPHIVKLSLLLDVQYNEIIKILQSRNFTCSPFKHSSAFLPADEREPRIQVKGCTLVKLLITRARHQSRISKKKRNIMEKSLETIRQCFNN